MIFRKMRTANSCYSVWSDTLFMLEDIWGKSKIQCLTGLSSSWYALLASNVSIWQWLSNLPTPVLKSADEILGTSFYTRRLPVEICR